MMETQVLLEEQDIAEALQLLTNEEAVDIIRNIWNKNLIWISKAISYKGSSKSNCDKAISF